MTTRALKMLFTTLKDNIRLVVLNACYSREQAQALVEIIDCVIGMKESIGNDAAIAFVFSFYRAIGFGRSIQEAFKLGLPSLLLEGIAEEEIPELLVKEGVDANKVVVQPQQTGMGKNTIEITGPVQGLTIGDYQDINEIFRDFLNPPKSSELSTRYTDISCPRRVWIETKRITVVVRLTTHPSIYSDATEPMLVQHGMPVRVRIDAPGFDLLGPTEQEIAILPDTNSSPVVFDLCPYQIGHTHVIFDFFQADNPVGTASIPVEITAGEVSATSEVHAGPLLRSGTGIEPPDLILYITYERFLTPPALPLNCVQ